MKNSIKKILDALGQKMESALIIFKILGKKSKVDIKKDSVLKKTFIKF